MHFEYSVSGSSYVIFESVPVTVYVFESASYETTMLFPSPSPVTLLSVHVPLT